MKVFDRSSQEDARDDFENETAEDDEAEENQPDWGNRGLGHVLGSLLDLLLRLAHARLVPLGELEVCPPLLRCLGHCEDVVESGGGTRSASGRDFGRGEQHKEFEVGQK
jgi:hypothetical protein